MFKDLPTLQELFSKADRELLIDLILKRAIACEVGPSLRGSEKISKKRRKQASKRLGASLDDMLKVKAKKSKKWCLFPLMLINEDIRECDMPVSVSVECIERIDFPKSKAIADNSIDAVDEIEVPSYSIIHSHWEEVLGYRVWLGGCDSRLERYLFLVDAFWEMTFLGFRKKTHDKNIAKDDKRIERIVRELEEDKPDKGKKPTTMMTREVFEKKHLGLVDFGLRTDAVLLEEEFRDSAQGFINRANKVATYEFHQRVAKLVSLLQAAGDYESRFLEDEERPEYEFKIQAN